METREGNLMTTLLLENKCDHQCSAGTARGPGPAVNRWHLRSWEGEESGPRNEGTVTITSRQCRCYDGVSSGPLPDQGSPGRRKGISRPEHQGRTEGPVWQESKCQGQEGLALLERGRDQGQSGPTRRAQQLQCRALP